jgi:hypothetical protein
MIPREEIPVSENIVVQRFVPRIMMIYDQRRLYFYRADASTVNDGYVYNLTEFGQVCESRIMIVEYYYYLYVRRGS